MIKVGRDIGNHKYVLVCNKPHYSIRCAECKKELAVYVIDREDGLLDPFRDYERLISGS
jgi:hypothetical protein